MLKKASLVSRLARTRAPFFCRRATRSYRPSQVARSEEAVDGPKFDFERNPFKAKHTWPPDFSKLSDKQRFRLERRYRRRSKLKWARPRLMMFTKLAQWGGCLGILTYGVFFMDWGNEEAFKGIREWYKQKTSSLFSSKGTPEAQS